MKKITLASSLCFMLGLLTHSIVAQVGVNTTSPQSTLDIVASNPTNPNNTDGILIPRLNTFPSSDPGPDQNGMLIFLTQDISGYFKGFHYWDEPLKDWIPFATEEWKNGVNASGDDLIFAGQAKNAGTDVVITDDGRIGFGTEDPVERFEFKGPGDNDFQITSANTNPPNLILYNTGGTLAAPAAFANANQEIGSLIVKTHDGSAIREPGGFRFYIDGMATPGSTPSKFIINTTPSGSTSQQPRITVRSTGNTGIGTENPTRLLDVAGDARVRGLGAGAVYSDANGNLSNTPIGPQTVAAGLVQGNGTALKIFGATVSRIDEGDYQVTFTTPRATANYVINLATADCGGNCNGSTNTYDDPGISYYQRTTTGFRINIGDSDNGTTAKDDIDIEFTFSVIDF